MRRVQLAIAVLALFGTGVCAAAGLRVALYPYVPDAAEDQFEAYKNEVKMRFEAQNKGIELKVDILVFDENWKRVQPGVEPYSFDELISVLSGDGVYDLVEIDTALLGELYEAGVIRGWTDDINDPESGKIDLTKRGDWHPAALEGVTYDDAIAAYPHLLCSHFVFSRAASLQQADSFAEIIAAVTPDGSASPAIGFEFTGSWGIPAFALDLAYDRGGDSSSLYTLLDDSLEPLQELLEWCPEDSSGADRCRLEAYEGGYSPDTLASELLSGSVSAIVGYSERLHPIRKMASESIYFNTFILSSTSIPIAFVDAFVLRAGCANDCGDAAQKFVSFINSEEELELFLMSKDADGAPPRYLLPANSAAYSTSIGRDQLYSRLKELMENARSFPNAGFVSSRHALRARVLSEVEP